MIETIRYELVLLLLGTTLLSFSGQGQENYEDLGNIEVWEIVESEGGIDAEISDESAINSKEAASIAVSQYEAALRQFDETIQMMPACVYPWGGRGFVLAAFGRYYESVAAFNKVFEAEPNNADAWHSRGPRPLELGGNSEVYVALAGEGFLDTRADPAYGAVYLQSP